MFYFSTERPISPGSLPRHLKLLSIENFPEKRYCPEIEGEAWGKVEFAQPLSGYEAMFSELVPDGSRHYFGVRYARHGRQYVSPCPLVVDRNGLPQMRKMSAYGIEKPSNKIEIRTKPEEKNFYDAWFDTEEERDQFVNELKEKAAHEDQY